MDNDRRKVDILRRLKNVEGHVRGIQRMVEEGHYCIDIINQSAAVQAALEKVNAMVLERHLQTCVSKAIRSEDRAERERVIGELLQVFQGRGQLSRKGSIAAEDEDLEAAANGSSEGCKTHGR